MRSEIVICLLVILFCLNFASSATSQKLELPPFFSDHMVLQRHRPVQVWGSGPPLQKVLVTIGSETSITKSDLTGHWRVKLKARPAGGPFELKIVGDRTIVVHDVLFGDVWLCSGQSNMSMSMRACRVASSDLQFSEADKLRHFIRVEPKIESTDMPIHWKLARADDVPTFSAVAYYLSRRLVAETHVPIGIIETPVGGSVIKCWISQKTLHKRGRTNTWVHSELYDRCIEPFAGLSLKGIVWYQGESDVFGACEYTKLLGELVSDWRRTFDQPNLPFYFVQLPNYGKPEDRPSDSLWAEEREAQLRFAQGSTPNVHMTVNIDTVEIEGGKDRADIHPICKREVADRLARTILAVEYAKRPPAISPTPDSYERVGNKFEVTFKDAPTGLYSSTEVIKGFAVAGADRKFYWAKAALLAGGTGVEVWNDLIKNPVAVRYAWADNPSCSLYGKSGLPVSPFRTDDWRPPEFTQHGPGRKKDA